MSRVGLVGLGMLPGPMRRPFAARHALLRPADYEGVSVGIQQNEVGVRTMRALGARPVRIPVEGDVSRLGAMEAQIASVQGNGYDAYDPFFAANVELWPRPLVLFANSKAFARLSASQRGALREAAAASARTETGTVLNLERQAMATLCRAGRIRVGVATTSDIEALRRAVQPVYQWLDRDPGTRDLITRIQAIRAQHPDDRDPVPSCAFQTRAEISTAPTPIDGIYTVSFTPKELLARGSPDALPENYGRFTVTLDRGWFEMTQKSARAQTWAAGTVTVKGNTFRIVNLGVGGIQPDNAAGTVGDTALFHWSLYRGRMTWSGTPVLNFEVKPWRRIGDAPSQTTATPAAALDGTWRAENGHMILVLRDGRFSLEPKRQTPIAGSTYRVLGNQIRFRPPDGEFWSYTWRLDNGRLRFLHPPGDHSREGWNLDLSIGAWTRVSP